MPLWGGPCARDIKSAFARVIGRFVHQHLLSCVYLSLQVSLTSRCPVVASIFIATYQLPSFDQQSTHR